MARYQILYWKDIPAQVRVFPDAGRPLSRQLPERFQQEIDARAMTEGLTGTAWAEQPVRTPVTQGDQSICSSRLRGV